ncbi:MAG: hypothetical protein JXL84_15575 [Deltaproteobacteria bacterium]|nr:hypothetical protein [Deltaproteobacteria bacterium]
MNKKDEEQESCGCGNFCGGIDVPTEAERVALDGMRSVRNEAKALKEKMARIEKEGSAEEKAERDLVRREIDRLRSEWQEWEKKREEAAKERMILLGHEKPDNN